MIISALISECRREFRDVPKSTQVARAADGAATLFNLGKFPVIEGSYSIYFNSTGKTETADYTLDKDNGDLVTTVAQAAGVIIKSTHKYANFNDRQWVEAINHGIERLNARGFFRQVVRDTSVLALSANVRVYTGPTNAIDVYELLESSNFNISGSALRLPYNWSYQQDGNKIVLGNKPSRANVLFTSYLRNLKTYSATSATLDALDDWREPIKKAAGSFYFRSLAGKLAQEGNANIEEGHFSFTNLRTMANDLEREFEILTARKKPTRPAKEIQYHIPGGGVA